MQSSTRRAMTFILVLTLASGGAMALADPTPAVDARVAAARDVAQALQHAGTDPASLRALAQQVAALHLRPTPGQEAALAAAGPVAPNHAAFAAALPGLSGVAVAQAATRAQAEALGEALPVLAPAGHATPSAALFALLDAYGHAPTEAQAAQARALDALPPASALRLARVLDAFRLMDAEAAAAFEADAGSPAWGRVLAARVLLLDAVDQLARDLGPTPMHAPLQVDIPPFVKIDYGLADDTYLENYVFSLDVGGNDVYLNNAGGTWIGNCDLPSYASAAIDLAGDDHYNDWTAPRHDACGKNGGSMTGVGFLLDALGNDGYGVWSLHSGVNGGAHGPASLGFLLDLDGWDAYSAAGAGTNGGGYEGGVGLLVDAGLGWNSFEAGERGANGGAYSTLLPTLGMLVDAGLSGSLRARDLGTNGGGYGPGAVGFAYASGGFQAGSHGTNGGGSNLGAGTLLAPLGGAFRAGGSGTNGGGDNLGTGAVYATGGSYDGWSNGVNGGGSAAGRGTLVDPLAWSLTAGGSGTNGGATGLGSSGFLLGGGSFSAGGGGANGGGALNGVGFLLAPGGGSMSAGSHGVNGGGSDGGVGSAVLAFLSGASATGNGANGGGYSNGRGVLVAAAGDAVYSGGSLGANGGGFASGEGVLIDLTGNDVYLAGSAGNGCVVGIGGTGLLLDAQGYDTYNGVPNHTAVPCGVGGARVDVLPS